MLLGEYSIKEMHQIENINNDVIAPRSPATSLKRPPSNSSLNASDEVLLQEILDLSLRMTTLPNEHEVLLKETTDIRPLAVKISNISWDLSSSDVLAYLSGTDGNLQKHHIHIPIDRLTGKTKADMYVEISSMTDGLRCIAKHHKRLWRGRSISVSLASLEEVDRAHFHPLPELLHEYQLFPYEIISETECSSLLNICRNYKAHFSRKCAERPFEHVISILRLVPWYLLTEKMTSRFYGVVGGAVEALTDHLIQRPLRRSASNNILLSHNTTPSSSFEKINITPSTPITLNSNNHNPFLPDYNSPIITDQSYSYGSCYGDDVSSFPPISGGHEVSSCGPQLGSELLERLLWASNTFPAFTLEQKMAIAHIPLSRVKQHRSSTSTTSAGTSKASRHLRRSSIDRILEELSKADKRSYYEQGPHNDRRSGQLDQFMKNAFDQIMLSSPSSSSSPDKL